MEHFIDKITFRAMVLNYLKMYSRHVWCTSAIGSNAIHRVQHECSFSVPRNRCAVRSPAGNPCHDNELVICNGAKKRAESVEFKQSDVKSSEKMEGTSTNAQIKISKQYARSASKNKQWSLQLTSALFLVHVLRCLLAYLSHWNSFQDIKHL